MKTHPMITCKEFEAFIIDYLEGDLPFVKRVVFNAHLMMCRDCRRYLQAYEDARRLGRAAFEDEVLIPDSVPDDLVEAVVKTINRGNRS